MTPYADKDELIADYIPEAKSDREKAAVGRILDAASAFVDSYCKRAPGYFSPSPTEATMKRVRGEGHHYLRLPVHVFGSVAIENLDSSIFYESDKNGWVYFESEEFGNENNFYIGFDCRAFLENKIYKVTARWGFEATPLPVVEAVRLIVARIYAVQRGTIGQITTEGFIQERLIPAAAKDLLAQFIKREFER